MQEPGSHCPICIAEFAGKTCGYRGYCGKMIVQFMFKPFAGIIL